MGIEHIGLWAMRQVSFVDLLIEAGISGPLRAAILGVIIGRMAAPGSELAAHRWLGQLSALGELLEVDFGRMPLIRERFAGKVGKSGEGIPRCFSNQRNRWHQSTL